MSKELEIIHYDPQYKSYFKSLNYEWLEKYYEVSETDEMILSNPEKIIAEHGRIFFAKYNNEIVGTCALVWYQDHWLELIKMAVTEKYQGLQIGFHLINYAIEEAKKMQEEVLVLETADELKAAIHLYEKVGFRREKLPYTHYEYDRTVFGMRLNLV